MNGSCEYRKITRTLIKKALRELAESMEECTQYDIHAWIEGVLGRPLTPAEKSKITQIVSHQVELKEVKRDPNSTIRIYIFML